MPCTNDNDLRFLLLQSTSKVLPATTKLTSKFWLTYVDVGGRTWTYVDVRRRTSTFVDVRRLAAHHTCSHDEFAWSLSRSALEEFAFHLLRHPHEVRHHTALIFFFFFFNLAPYSVAKSDALPRPLPAGSGYCTQHSFLIWLAHF